MKGNDCKWCRWVLKVSEVLIVICAVSLLVILALKADAGMPEQQAIEVVIEQGGQPWLVQALASVAAIVTVIGGFFGLRKRQRRKADDRAYEEWKAARHELAAKAEHPKPAPRKPRGRHVNQANRR